MTTGRQPLNTSLLRATGQEQWRMTIGSVYWSMTTAVATDGLLTTDHNQWHMTTDHDRQSPTMIYDCQPYPELQRLPTICQWLVAIMYD